MQFRKGQMIRCLESYGDQFTAGVEYEVARDVVGAIVSVVCDDNGSNTNGWAVEKFEPVETFMYGDLSESLIPLGEAYEDCSEYRAAWDSERGWVVEANRISYIAQAANETEAHRIATALNMATVV